MKLDYTPSYFTLFIFIVTNLHFINGQSLIVSERQENSNLEIEICDEDGDGFLQFNIEELEEFILESVDIQSNFFQEEIYISTSEGNVLSLTSPSNNPELSILCNFGSQSFTDIAVDSNQQIYLCGNSISRVDPDCDIFYYNHSFFQNNALSFDDLDNLYVGIGTDSEVYRFTINDQTISNFEVWHDFQTGGSGGDFVLVGNKMYVAWRLAEDNYRLYEITVDSGRNYVSHVDLGQLRNKTYGLASELGKLYGVTPTRLYEIDLSDFTFQNIYSNPNPSDEWYGAAGLHEAIAFDISTHVSNEDAQNDTNEINGNWTNTIQFGQTLYFRIENPSTGEFEIVLLTLDINVPPNVNEPNDLAICYLDSFHIFDLNQVSEQMQINPEDELVFTYYNENPEINPNASPLATFYQSTSLSETIYVTVAELDNECSSLYEFQVINSQAPECVITFPKFITPNADGFNDYFNVLGASDDIILGSRIIIFDRYGKTLGSFVPYQSNGWDGTYNGNRLPSSDYWYLFKMDSGYTIKGHFSLKW